MRLSPSADTYIDAAETAREHGNSLTLKVGSEGVVDRFRMLVSFDLEGAAPSNAHLLDAWLELQASVLPDVQPMAITVHRLSRAFDEDSATWQEFQLDDAWSSPGGDFDARAAATRDQVNLDTLTSFDVFDDFARQLSEGVPYYGWMIRSTAPTGAEFHSRERAPGISPMLVLEYCPQ